MNQTRIPLSSKRKRYHDENNLLLVVAGTYDEYLRFRDKSRRKMRFVENEHQLYGMAGTDIIKIGSWYNREDSDDINKAITAKRLNEVKKL